MDQQQAQNLQSDEIDLRELLCALWNQKILIVVCTLVVTGLAASYAFFSTPIYEATVQTLPPTASNLAAYNAGSQLTGTAISGVVNTGSSDSPEGIEVITPKDAYDAFLRQLSSETVRQTFFEKYYLPVHGDASDRGSVERAWEMLDDDLTISKPKNANEFVAKVTLQGDSPQMIAEWGNHYVDIAASRTRQEFIENLRGEVEVRKQGVEDQIATLRKVAQTALQNRITRLEGALAVAESIGLEEPPTGSTLIAISGSNRTDIDTFANESMMYLRGSKALRAELDALKSRGEHDAYIPELHDLLKKQALLDSIDLDLKALKVVSIDRAATAPVDPVKPQKLLILALGIVLGGMLGIFLALIRYILKPKAI